MLKQNNFFVVVLNTYGLNILMLCASVELLDLGGDNEGFNSGQQVLAAGMRCSACNRVVGLILHHLGVKGAVQLLIAVLGHLVPSSCCWGCRRGQGKTLCVSEARRELKLGGAMPLPV